eukprot:754257-Pyramimonas_sp.AAC.2
MNKYNHGASLATRWGTFKASLATIVRSVAESPTAPPFFSARTPLLPLLATARGMLGKPFYRHF